MSRPVPCLACGTVLPSMRLLYRHELGTGHARDSVRLLEALTEAVPSGCWEYRGPVSKAVGYGVVGRLWAHRLAFEAFVGPIPKGLEVCHSCDNRPCVNPAHLFLGTAADNARDAMSKGRHAHGERHGLARLTVAAVLEIRASSESKRLLALRFGVSRGAIGFVRNRTTWGHVA